jgi:hypothetical protein
MEIKDYIPIVGWIVTFILGAISAGTIVPRLNRKRKIIAWAVISESDLIPRELSQVLGIQVTIQVGDYQPDSLSTVKLRFGSIGNDIVEKFALAVTFNKGTSILRVQPVVDLGEYGKNITWANDQNFCRIDISFINPGSSFELEFLLSNHEPGNITVDAAEPGLELRRKVPSVLDAEISPSILRSVRVGIFGLSFEPTAISMAEIADELRRIRKQMNRP